ncbi:MAG TPA: class I SAM-dependent methyltransferase [Xanthobacteraceae bacterium]|nr:class I SAM-dependent methyltransferase [Xanthobacteraceae bacterium]
MPGHIPVIAAIRIWRSFGATSLAISALPHPGESEGLMLFPSDLEMSRTSRLFADGEAYERLMGRWSRVAGEIFLEWLDIPANCRWLDVGCGNGAFTEALIERCAPVEIVGLDPSEGQLAFARTRPGARSAKFRIGDAHELPFGEERFDIAIMALVVTYLSEPGKAVSEMARVVRPGGWVATYTWDIPGAGTPVHPIYVAMESLGMAAPRPPAAAASRCDALRALWEDAGLELIETRVIRIPVVYSDFDDFWDANSAPAGASGKAIHDLSPAARERLRARVREQLPLGSDGRIAYESFANAVKGRVRM